jgi:hypothetical protein
MLRAMNTARPKSLRWPAPLAASLLLLAGAAHAAVTMEGVVTLDYYVADVDAEGFENTAAEIFVESVVNDSSGATGPLSLGGWLTSDPAATGNGTEAGYLPLGSIPGSSSLEDILDTVAADDAAPGEYYAHLLLQDDDFPGTFEDSRSLSPRLLWRGGLEAVGPLDVFPYAGASEFAIDFAQLRNNRLDSRYTNDIILTLYATHGFGPASSGHVLCEVAVAGLYAGDSRVAPGFDCSAQSIPDGEYTLHLEVAEDGGRGGYSTLSGPDVRVYGGRIDDGHAHGVVYVGALGGWSVAALAALLALRLAPGVFYGRRRSA